MVAGRKHSLPPHWMQGDYLRRTYSAPPRACGIRAAVEAQLRDNVQLSATTVHVRHHCALAGAAVTWVQGNVFGQMLCVRVLGRHHHPKLIADHQHHRAFCRGPPAWARPEHRPPAQLLPVNRRCCRWILSGLKRFCLGSARRGRCAPGPPPTAISTSLGPCSSTATFMTGPSSAEPCNQPARPAPSCHTTCMAQQAPMNPTAACVGGQPMESETQLRQQRGPGGRVVCGSACASS